jgi:two-component system sensor kinase FixL
LAMDYTDNFDQQGKEWTNLIVKRAKRMDKVIDSILVYSEVGRIGQKGKKVDMNAVLSEVIQEIGPLENIEIVVEGELPTIDLIFNNLLRNAVRYMDKPKGKIRVDCCEENNFWKFSVCDNGPGIEQRYFEKIFKIFQTLSPRDEFEAIGIGLSLTKKIVDLYGGRIWLQSKPGEGSTFYFTLPKQEMGVKDEKLKADAAC